MREVLNRALAQFQNQKAGLEDVGVTDHSLDELITAIKEALAQSEQEPVAWKDLTNAEMMALCRDIESRKHSAYDILWEASTRLKARNTTPPQPQSEARGLSQSKPLTDEKVSLIAHNIDSGDWNDLNFKECWYEGFKAGFREAEIEHNIKGTT